jgi:isoleucyl-tRNA synthetase
MTTESGKMTPEAPNYKATLSITQTAFPQKAALAASEPVRLAKWREMGLEALLEKKGAGRPKYVLHDGPPYANGDIHLGTALNKTLKDIVVRYRTMRGYSARYVPGFDCHGLPIEQKVLEKLGRKEGEHSQLEIRRLCHEYATRYIGLQTEQFQRLGIGGDWEHPYLTLDPKFEVGILTALRAMVARGSVYKGFKPVWWDPRFRTALAEAELEYERHTSPSIYVRFPVRNLSKVAAFAAFADAPANVVIWTTTPWTLPGDQAVTVNKDFGYVLFETEGRAEVGAPAVSERMIAAQDLLEAFVKEAGLAEPKILAKVPGAALEGLLLGHPLLPKDVPVILGDHVTLEQGTGCVHTAPGHGPDDFEVCKRYGIEAIVPVDEGGCYNEEYPEMQGTFVFAANPKVIAKLEEKGILVWQGKIEHDYPYSWRSHEPVIVRATHQWFMRMDHDGIREKCLKAIDEDVRWVPAWGHDRIRNMMVGRPDWCLSRQRSWGVPIPALFSVEANQSILCVEVIDRFQELVAEHGTDCWFSLPVEAFIPEGFKCPISGGTKFEKEHDILDVWFDSGSSHISVLESDPGLQSPADLYLEGSDQHRGWFMSSLVTSMAARDRAPYKAVLTHGWVLDGKGQAMHKSKGNVIPPSDIVKQMGADVLRLWVISEDFRNDVRASDSILKQMMETYRRIRNTLRFLLGNLADFDPAKDAVAPRARAEIDRWALASLAGLVDGVTQAYEDFEFHKIYHLVNQFCVVTLSALYLDILKDRLYCSAPTDPVRRSAQSTVWDIFSALTRMLAPILPFTSDEAHEYGHPTQPSIHLEDFPVAPEEWRERDLLRRWERILAVRDFVNVPLEQARRTGEIGKSLDGAVVLRPRTRELAQFLEANLDTLREVCIVSQCRVDAACVGEGTFEKLEEALEVTVGKASGEKCARCWCYDEAIGRDEEHPPLCPRCSDVVRRLANI